MPELPDVELFKRYLDHAALQRRVVAVHTHRVQRLLDGLSRRQLRRRVRGHRLASTRRHGKYLFVGLDDGAGHLVLHFGMTGFLRAFRRIDSAPDHARLVFDLDDGLHLAYDCQRLFGRIAFAGNAEAWIDRQALGPDALELDAEGFADRLADRRGSLKSTLMNQSVLAGLGNVYSDEILFRARLHPLTRPRRLDAQRLRALHRSLRSVLLGAIRYRADPEALPKTWLLPHRAEGERCPRCGGPVRRIRVHQRSAWICGTCQKRH